MKRTIALVSLLGFLAVTGCLPGEQDVSEKYNDINQRTQIENTGMSLMQAANSMTAYLVADSMRLKAPLSDEGITGLRSVKDNVKPTMPPGVIAVPCGGDGIASLAYFTAQPKGVPDLKNSGETMAKALSQRFGAAFVGFKKSGDGIQLPKVAADVGCTVGGDIIANSPIFAAGFEYKGYEGTLGAVLPDAQMATQPSILRDITLPCPSGMQGVIKREQECKLISSSDKKEKAKVQLGDDKYANTVSRLDKEWRCNPDLATPLSPTADEITQYCIDPNAGLAKQPDNTINLATDNVKRILETGAGVYDFKCRRNADGTNSCDAQPYTPPANVPRNTVLRCDPRPVPEQYVINPVLPVQVDSAGKVISETPAATKTGAILGNRSCGQGWMGDLIAGYQVRACQLVKIENGVTTPIKLAQTIYKIGYVGARCTAPPKEATYSCPRPYDGNVILRESNYMTKPLALQLGNAPAGDWSPSTIPWRFPGFGFGNANAETVARAAQEDYRISFWPLEGVQNPDFSSLLTATMKPYMEKDITGCKLAGQTCELPPDPIDVGIVFDRSTSMVDEPPFVLTSSTNRMECQALLDDIFTDKTAACQILRNNALGRTDNYGRPVEAILGEYLVDPDDPVLNNMMFNAVQNQELCGSTSVDKVGTCKPGGSENQSSCAPGRCVGRGDITGNKVIVSEDQLKTAINYFPPGSQAWFTQYAAPGNVSGSVEPTKFKTLCNYVTDENCDFAAAQTGLRDDFLSDYKGTAQAGGTPLMEAADQTLKQMLGPTYANGSTKGGILLFFTDGAETDSIGSQSFRSGYPFPFGSLCNSTFPTSRLDGNRDEFCRQIGLHEGADKDPVQVEDDLSDYYDTYDCGLPQNAGNAICSNILYFYDGDKLVGGATGKWRECLSVGNSNRPNFVEFVQTRLPNLRVFILNLGSRQLANCPRDPNSNIQMVDVDDPTGYERAFTRAFKDLNTKPVSPLDVCRRIRLKYKNAVDY